MCTKWILIILKALITIVLDSMHEIEQSGDKDADGVPLSKEYDVQGYILASLRDIQTFVEQNLYDYEK